MLHYKLLFPDYEVLGLDYQTFTPWETGIEIHKAVEELKTKYKNVILIANSIGAYFSLNAGIGQMIQKAYFISPVVEHGLMGFRKKMNTKPKLHLFTRLPEKEDGLWMVSVFL